MHDLGYEYVVLDDCWSSKTRDENGELQADSKKFPSGMKSLASYVHSKGLKFGLYTSVGDVTCKGDRPGSLDKYETDAKTLSSWGIDFIKMDHCGDKHNRTDIELYGTMSLALNKTGRSILFSLCNWGEENVWDWGSNISQMYRIQQDHLPFWSYSIGQAQGVGYGQGTKEIIEWMAHLDPSKHTREYGYMDPDFLMTMFDPLTMTFTESRTEYTFWALWSSPLLVCTDIRDMSKEKQSILMNEEVIAVNQDDLFTGGTRIRNNSVDGTQIWTKPLSNGDVAVVLYNSNSRGGDIDISFRWSDLVGFNDDDSISLRNLWTKSDLNNNVTLGSFSSSVSPRDILFLRASKL